MRIWFDENTGVGLNPLFKNIPSDLLLCVITVTDFGLKVCFHDSFVLLLVLVVGDVIFVPDNADYLLFDAYRKICKRYAGLPQNNMLIVYVLPGSA